MGDYNRGGRGGGYQSRDSYSPRGRSNFSRGGGRSFDRGDRGDRQMFDATCSNCGKPCQVPFRPTNGKPVYCSDCFDKMGGRNESPRPERSDFRPKAPAFDQNNAQLEAINAKLDKLIKLLEPKTEEPTIPSPVLEAEVEPKEAKKPSSKKKE